MKKIKLYGKHGEGKFSKVSDCDYEKVLDLEWIVMDKPNGQYVFNCENRVYLHRYILNPDRGLVVDHINGDGLDNRRTNLRICTNKENSRNSAPCLLGKRKYKGVYIIKNKSGEKYFSQIGVNGKVIRVGLYNSETEAAIAYNKKAIEYFGEFARLNII